MDEKRVDIDGWKDIVRSAFILGMTGTPAEKEKATIDIGYYYMCCAPASLYKYYSDLPRNFEAVKNNKMWYSAPCCFNDVFDCTLTIEEKDIFDSTLRMVPDSMSIRKGSPMWKQIRGTVGQNIRTFLSSFDDLRSRMGISCLSETDDSLLMWAHYANNHSGLCVEYELLEFNRQLGFSPVPIVYSDDRVIIRTLETLGNDIQGLFIKSLTSKSPEWGYEKEWRIIRDDGACGEKWDSEKKGALLDAICPKSITLGCMAKPEYEQNVRKYCEENRINLYKMEMSRREYRLEKVVVLQFEE
jgi:hypothetical protein